MNTMKLLINIVKRESEEEYIQFYKKHEIAFFLATLCKGTASKNMLDYLGIERNEMVMFQSIVLDTSLKKLEHDLIYQMGIDVPGSGIALALPLDSVGGSLALSYLSGEQQVIEIGEVTNMSEKPYALLIAISEKGNIDTVMDAARSAGARGGTVINAKGTHGTSRTKFFGMSIAEEKDIIYIVAKQEEKNKIMQAIMEEAGMETKAHTAVFSLPVEFVAGMQLE
ncbi:MAG: P-II family nitrogen regulator [Clostridia bacterium]|nr:P-II family nitrogen regulator [Clostridia bacterium]